MTAKIKDLTADLVGKAVPDNVGGHAGRAIEQMMKDLGYPLQNGPGVDCAIYEGFEIKSRDLDATSPQTMATMNPDYVKKTPYAQTILCEKMQKQWRVYTQNRVVVKNTLTDFTGQQIQELIEEAYEICREKVIDGDESDYIYGTEYGYFEKTGSSNSYSYRISDGAMKKLEAMSRSTFNDMFEY